MSRRGEDDESCAKRFMNLPDLLFVNLYHNWGLRRRDDGKEAIYSSQSRGSTVDSDIRSRSSSLSLIIDESFSIISELSLFSRINQPDSASIADRDFK
jgi:hypothetical protein